MNRDLPLEIIYTIVAFAVKIPDEDIQLRAGQRSKNDWSAIHPFTLSCKTYRLVSLELWFETVITKQSDDLSTLRDLFPASQTWTKKVHCMIGLSSICEWDLSCLPQVTDLRVDYIDLHHPSETSASFYNADHVLKLTSVGHPWLDPFSLTTLAKQFPNLTVLTLDQANSWCSVCNLCAVPSFKSPGPSALVYTDGFGLPIHWASVMSQNGFHSLKTVFITVANLGFGTSTLHTKPGGNPHLWSGECNECIELLNSEHDLREKQLARKRGESIGNNDFTYVKLPALSLVEWCFRPLWPEELEGRESSDEESDSDSDP